MTHISTDQPRTGQGGELRGDAGLSASSSAIDRRLEPRSPTHADLWMIDHQGATILRCQCEDVSSTGMRLRVPLGYGVTEGQRYEIRSHSGDYAHMLGMDFMRRRWATVVRARVHFGSVEDHLEIGVVFDAFDKEEINTPYVGMV